MDNQNRNSTIFDEDTLIALYEDHSDLIYRYAYRYLSQEDLAEECVSDVFTRFLERVTTKKALNGNIKAYLYRMAHNWIVDYYRKRKPDEYLEAESVPSNKSNPELHFSEKQRRERLRKALLNLPDDQRSVVELHVLEQWPHEKVAEVLGKTVEASRALQYRALRNLRQIIDGRWM